MYRNLFHPNFAAHHRPTLAATRAGAVKIERVLSQGEWNPATGLAQDEMLTLFVGSARVQKVSMTRRMEFVEDTMDYQNIRVQIDTTENEVAWPADFEWHDNDRVTVTASPIDPQMVGLITYLHSWMGSTNSLTRTLSCRTDAKQVGA